MPARDTVRHAAQFIWLVRHCLDDQVLWRLALPLFKRRLYFYLKQFPYTDVLLLLQLKREQVRWLRGEVVISRFLISG